MSLPPPTMSPAEQLAALVRHHIFLRSRPFLDVHVADHCNLQCAGCLHYAPIAKKRLLDLQQYESDLAALAAVAGIHDYFGTEFVYEQGDFVSIADLHDIDELRAFQRSPHPMCRYCLSTSVRVVEWERSRREAAEWLLVEP